VVDGPFAESKESLPAALLLRLRISAVEISRDYPDFRSAAKWKYVKS
jgi:hypothetical protein